MPAHKVYHGATVRNGELVPSTGELVLRFHPKLRTVCGTTTPDGRELFSVFEFMNIVYEKPGADEWRRLRTSDLKKDIRKMKTGRVDADLAEMVDVKVKKRSKFKFIYASQPAMTVRGLQWLLAQLGAEVDEFLQEAVGGVLAEYLAGNRGMVHAGVACTTVAGQRTLSRRDRAEAVAAVADVTKRDRTLSERAVDKRQRAEDEEAGGALKRQRAHEFEHSRVYGLARRV